MMKKQEVECTIDGWFSFHITDKWKYDIENDILSIYPLNNGRGVIQISFFHRSESEKCMSDVATEHLDRFVSQYKINIDVLTRKVIEGPYYTVANASGVYNNEFIKIWTLVNEHKMLLITYISNKKTRELSTAESIVYSIIFID